MYFNFNVAILDCAEIVIGNFVRKENLHLTLKFLGYITEDEIEKIKNKLDEIKFSMDKKQEKYFVGFTENLKDGIAYYHNLFSNVKDSFEEVRYSILNELEVSNKSLQLITLEIEKLKFLK